MFERELEWREFRSEIRNWISENPALAQRLLEKALGQIRSSPMSLTSLTQEAQWAARWARALWAQAGLEPPELR